MSVELVDPSKKSFVTCSE